VASESCHRPPREHLAEIKPLDGISSGNPAFQDELRSPSDVRCPKWDWTKEMECSFVVKAMFKMAPRQIPRDS